VIKIWVVCRDIRSRIDHTGVSKRNLQYCWCAHCTTDLYEGVLISP